MNAATIVQKLWNYCNILRDDGLSYLRTNMHFMLKENPLKRALEQMREIAADLNGGEAKSKA